MECFSYEGGCDTHVSRHLRKRRVGFSLIKILLKTISYIYVRSTKIPKNKAIFKYFMHWFDLSDHVICDCGIVFFNYSAFLHSHKPCHHGILQYLLKKVSFTHCCTCGIITQCTVAIPCFFRY